MKHTLPDLPYAYDALEPHIDEKTMRLHHDIHHKGYVSGLNAAEQYIAKCRQEKDFSGLKNALVAQSFHGCGHHLHTLFWNNMSPVGSDENPSAEILKQIEKDFGSFDVFEQEFEAAGASVEGSGWVILGWDGMALVIHQHENHQNKTVVGVQPLLVCDVWEHAYYLKYQNKRGEYLKNFWNIVNWTEVSKRFSDAQ